MAANFYAVQVRILIAHTPTSCVDFSCVKKQKHSNLQSCAKKDAGYVSC